MRSRLLPLLAVLAAAVAVAAPARALAAADESANLGVTPGHTSFASGGSLERPPLRTRWARTLGTYVGDPLIGGGRVYVTAGDDAHADATLYALDAVTGTTVWSRPLTGSAEIAYDDGRVFVAERAGPLVAVSAATGATQWILTLPESYHPETPVADGGTVYLTSAWSGGSLWAFDERDGSTRWRADSDGGSPALDARFVYASDHYSGATTAYARDDGRVAWYGATRCIPSSGGAVADGARVAGPVASGCGALSDAASGRLLSTFSSSLATAAAGDVGVTMNARTLQARSLSSGVLLWEFAGDGLLRGAPIVVNETVYERSATGALFALDLRTGAQLWSGSLAPFDFYTDPPGMAAAAGTLIVPGGTGTVTALESTRAPRPGLDLRMTAGPDGPTTATSATLTFASSALGAPTTCRLDAGPWLPCLGSASYPSLADGPHVFEVQTHDLLDGSVVALATRGWSVDTTAPVATITQAPPSLTTYPTAYIHVTSDDLAAALECRVDDGAWNACRPGDPVYNAYIVYGLADGRHQIEARARDALGNVQSPPATRFWTVDATRPVTTISGGPQGSTTATSATFTFSAGEPATFVCAMDGAPFAACSSPFAMSGVAEGFHVLQVWATDAAGNTELAPVRRTWRVVAPSADVTPPMTRITAAPPAVTAATTARLQFAADEQGTTECRLDGSVWVLCWSPWDLTGLSDGDHGFEVRTTDEAGNVESTPATWTWTVDTRPPQTHATVAPGNVVRFSFGADEPSTTFECAVDGGSWTPCESGVGYETLAAGNHVFAVRATDAAGNQEAAGPTLPFTARGPATFAPPAVRIPAGPSRPAAAVAVAVAPSNSAPALARMLADETAAVLRSSTRRALRGRPSLVVRASGPARLAVTVTTREHGRSVTFARAQTTFTADGTRRVRLRLSDAGRRRLSREGRIALRIRATVTPASGAAAAARATARV